MPLTGLEPLDSSWQPARAFVINDRRLQANRVDHRPLAGCSLHNLGSGQQVAAGARRRGGAARIRSAAGFSCSGGATTGWVGGAAGRILGRGGFPPATAAQGAVSYSAAVAVLFARVSKGACVSRGFDLRAWVGLCCPHLG